MNEEMSAKQAKRIVGIVLILMSIAHVIYGEVMLVRELKSLSADGFLIGSYRVMSLQGGMLLAAVGIVEWLSAERIIALFGFSAYIPLGIVAINLLSFVIVVAAVHRELIQYTLPQCMIFIVIIALQAWSLRVAI